MSPATIRRPWIGTALCLMAVAGGLVALVLSGRSDWRWAALVLLLLLLLLPAMYSAWSQWRYRRLRAAADQADVTTEKGSDQRVSNARNPVP